MELEGVVHDGVIVPDDASSLPEGVRVRYEVLPSKDSAPKSFAERYAKFKGCLPEGVPEDLSTQHEHYRLGTPKR
ncbi:MAG: hypothetical protein U0791_04965 [Gemmataceae bacterium]